MIDTSEMNTEEVLHIAKRYSKEHGVEDMVVATTSGETGVKASEIFEDEDINVLAVTHTTGFRDEGEQELEEENKEKMEDAGTTVFTGPMPFHSWNDHLRKRDGTITTTTVMADTLRLFGQGTKVCVEIVSMVSDAGLIPVDKPVLAVAGTHWGADTILLMEGKNSRRFFDMKVLDVVAKPKKW